MNASATARCIMETKLRGLTHKQTTTIIQKAIDIATEKKHKQLLTMIESTFEKGI